MAIISSKAIADPNRVPIGTDPREALFEQIQSNPGMIIPGASPTNMSVSPSGEINTSSEGIMNTLNLNARQVAEQNPELHEMRQKFFGQDYLSDIEKGDTGTVQYYTGLGDPNAINYTEAPIEESVEAIAPVETGIVDIGTGGTDISIDPIDTEQVIPPFIETEPNVLSAVDDTGQPISGNIVDPISGIVVAPGDYTDVAGTLADPDDPIDLIGTEPTPPFIETEPNVLTPPTLPGGAPISGPHGDFVITDPVTGDTYAPGDYTDVAGTLADPREKIDTLADTGGRDLPTIQQYADRSFGVDYDNVDDYEEQAAIDEAYNELYGTEYKQSPDITPLDILTMGLGTVAEVPLNIIKTGIETVMPDEPKDETVYGDSPVVSGTVFDAEDEEPSALDVATGIDDFEVSGDIAPGGMDQVLGPVVTTPTPRAPDFVTGGGDGGGIGSYSGPGSQGVAGDVQQSGPGRQDADTMSGGSGNGGSGGGGKIVCTMMNDSYGFGSFRNKIWLKHSKTLPMEYQLGYHALFLPLVKFAKQDGLLNKAVKKVLEHIAVHRTIDIRQESRGKTHMLGRIYRKILEPICYWVGKYGKRT